VLGGSRTVTRVWPDEPHVRDHLARPRDDLLTEESAADAGEGTLSFSQLHGPFRDYGRTVTVDGGRLIETTRFRVSIPWFGWVFLLPIRWELARRWHPPTREPMRRTPWWAPPDQLDQRQVSVIGLLAAASMASAFVNTLFTQTANLAAEQFGVGKTGLATGHAVVRAGIVLTIPLAMAADVGGRRRMIRVTAWMAPIVAALGALAPGFASLVGTQAIARPLGLALDFVVAVAIAEEMPRNSRAYAVSVLAMASGLGSGIAVMALPLAELGEGAWRLVYVVALIWLVVAWDLTRRLPETVRFERPHQLHPHFDRRRFAILATVAIAANFFVAPASAFQNDYLRDGRGFAVSAVSVFTLVTATPAGLGLVLGGRLADVRGRRRLIATAIPVATAMIVLSFSVSGPPMWVTAFAGGFLGGVAVPALAVYRAELFPTGNRGLASGLLTVAALVGGIGGLLIVGSLLDAGWSYGRAVGLVSLSELVVVAIVLTQLPETAHRELEELNPEDGVAPGSR
jgi:MFS family permease